VIWLIAWRLSRWLPVAVTAFIINHVTPLALRCGLIPRDQLRRNLTAVLGALPPRELDELVQRNIRSYARYWQEVFSLSRGGGRDLVRHVVVSDPQVLRDAVARGRGVVLALPHMANWDVAGAWAAQHYHVTTVAEQVTPQGLYECFRSMREGVGMQVIPLGAGLETLGLLRQALAAGGVVALVADRVVSGSTGVPVRFADQQAMLPAGPATLAYQSGAALIPVSLHYEGERMRLAFLPEVVVDSTQPRREEVARATQQLAHVFVAIVREHPQDWRALQPVVTDTPDVTTTPREKGAP